MESYIYVKIYANKTYNYPKLGVGINMKVIVIQWGCPYENEIYSYLMRVPVWVTTIPYGESECATDYSEADFPVWVWLPSNGVSIGVNMISRIFKKWN